MIDHRELSLVNSYRDIRNLAGGGVDLTGGALGVSTGDTTGAY